MSTPMTADEFLAQLAKWAVPHVEVLGWRHRNRDGFGAWGPVHGLLLHHTGDDAPDDADERVLTAGRADLPGPLCHWGMDDAGVAHLIGWGRANHAGKGAANVLAALLNEGYAAYPPPPGPDSVDGNTLLYGQETMYSGEHRMTDSAYTATVLVFAAVCDFHGWSAKSCIGHKEWTTRKVDPGHLDMAVFRRDVDAALAAGPTRPPITDTHLEGDMFIGGNGGRMWLYRGDGQKDYLASDDLVQFLTAAGVHNAGTVPAGVDVLFTNSAAVDTKLRQVAESIARIETAVVPTVAPAARALTGDVDER